MWFCLLAALAAATLPSAAPAQQPAQGVKTLQDLEDVLGEPESARIPVVRGLRRHAADGVTQALLEEFRTATNTAYRQALLDALGCVQRDGVADVLAEVAEAVDTPPMERMTAARGLASQGEEWVQRLGTMARESGVPMARSYAMMALSQVGSDAAWQLLAETIRDGDTAARSRGIRYLSRAPATEVVSAARLAAAADSNPSTATSAVRQLVDFDHPRAMELVRRLCSSNTPPRGFAAVDLFHAVCGMLEESLYGHALRLAGEVRKAGVSGTRALEEQMPRLLGDEAFLGFVRDQLVRVEEPGEIRVALLLLAEVPGEDVSAEIAAFAASRHVGIVATALDVLAKRGDKSVLPDLQKLLRVKDEGHRLEVLQCVHALRSDEPEWREDLLDRLKKTSRKRRAWAEFGLTLTLLGELGSEDALETAWKALDHDNWTVRAAAIDYCRHVRDVASVEKLFGRVDDESGRLREDLLDTLQSLTARRFLDQKLWRKWWRENEDGFELIPADTFAKDDRPRPTGGTTGSYYGLPLVSDRVVFVVDVSGSMSAPVGTSSSTRLAEAKRQLKRVLESRPKEFVFNVISFETTEHEMFDQMIPLTGGYRAEALERVEALRPMGGTNVYDAMKRAFEETELDTIYLLSDGAPSGGEITDPDQLAEVIKGWNRTRRIRIHCISIGAESAFLKRLAEDSGGEYASSR